MSPRRNRNFTESENIKTEETVEENIERAIEIDRAISEVMEQEVEEIVEEEKKEPPALNPDGTRFKSDKIFLGEEDRKLFNKANKRLMDKLGLSANRSIKI